MKKETKKMSKKTDGLGNNNKREEALVRIERLENAIMKLMPALHNSFKKSAEEAAEIAGNITNLDRFITALVEVLETKVLHGTDRTLLGDVKERVKNNRIAQVEAESEASVANLKIALAEGKVVVAETAKSDNDILVVSQVNEQGEALHPKKTFLTLSQFNPGVKELITDKKAGETVTLPTGGSITVLEIYSVVEQPETSETTETKAE